MLKSNCTKAFGMMQNADLETAEAEAAAGSVGKQVAKVALSAHVVTGLAVAVMDRFL